MKPEEIRMAIADHLGWRFAGTTAYHPTGTPYDMDGAFHLKIIPDFPNDLNAMHEAEMAFPLDKRKAMRFWLYELTDQMTAHSATALQRAEAFLKVIGKWKD